MLPWRWSPRPMGPTLTRTSRWTGKPTASNRRRTMRFLPEWSTTSISTWPGVESTRRKESTEANPSSSSTPAFGGDVEPANVEDAFAGILVVLQEVADAGPAFGVLHGGHHALGLVEHHVDQVFVQLDPQPVNVDDGSLGVHADTEFGDYLAVDFDPALGDHLLADAPGGNPCGGHHLLEADAVGIVEFGLGNVAPGAFLPDGLSDRTQVLAEAFAAEGT